VTIKERKDGTRKNNLLFDFVVDKGPKVRINNNNFGVNKIEKSKLSMRENKAASSSLIFHSIDGKLYIQSENNFCSSKFLLKNVQPTEDGTFGLDITTFFNALNNFPTEEIQFIYNLEENLLIFGNKKTRVSLASVPVDNFVLSFSDNLEPLDVTVDDFVHSIKMTSFSCAPDFDEHPYTSILWFIEDGKINAQSSDKHRISVFGKKYELQQSYLISKNISDVILYYIEKIPGIVFSLYNSKIYLTWDGGELSCNLEKNTYEKIFSNFNQFFSDQFFLTLELQKDALVKSVKFVSSIANSHMISLTLDVNKLVISANSNEKNAVVDTIEVENYEVLSVSYVSSHLIRVLDLLDSKKLKLNFIKHNDFILLMLEAENFKHILFPMD
jgi:DNA polymerase III sliding clamp (beta) subunit (PCNA family)